MQPKLKALGVVAAVSCFVFGESGVAHAGNVTITVAYSVTKTFNQVDKLMKTAKEEFEAAHTGANIKLEPITVVGDAYTSKIELLDRSASTQPDVQYEDTFKIQADAQAGFLLSIQRYLSSWKDWSQFSKNAQAAGKRADGKTYGVSMGTDTRGLYYNKVLFKQAGLTVPWSPKSWADVLSAAATIKAKLPNITPINVYSGMAADEASTMQGFEMLLYGTKDKLTNSAGKWVTGSKGFRDSLQFIHDVYQNPSGNLGPALSNALIPNIFSNISNVWLTGSTLAIDLDGSWLPRTWLPGGSHPWADWNTTLGEAPFPTEFGAAPGANSMSGGYTLAVGSHSKNAALAVQFIETALNKQNSLTYDVSSKQVAVRADVASAPTYKTTNPTAAFFSSLVPVTHFRPATTPYSNVSHQIDIAMEAVMTGIETPAQAQVGYDSALPGIVGARNTASATK